MKRSLHWRTVRTLISATACVLISSCTGCEQRAAIVEYRQIGACNGLSNLNGAGPNTVLVVFLVETIDNTLTGKDISFRRARVQTSEYEPSIPVTTVQFSTAIGIPPLKATTGVPKGTRAVVHRYVWFVLGTGDIDGAKEASGTSYFLRYEREANDPGIAMTKLDSARTQWPYTPRCQDIRFPPPSPPSSQGLGNIATGVVEGIKQNDGK
jgi:hypothetical protein